MSAGSDLSGDLSGSLTDELAPTAKPIELQDGTATVIVPCPLPARVWAWIFEHTMGKPIDPNRSDDDALAAEMLDRIAEQGERIMSLATDETVEKLRTLPGFDAAVDRLMGQIGGEMRNAAPFTNASARAGGRLFRRKLALVYQPDLAGGTASSQSSPKSAGETGTQ